MVDLWVEKHRPGTLDGYVFFSDSQKQQIEYWIAEGGIPNLLFSGSAGTGKTTLAHILLNSLRVDPADVLILNGSRENNVDTVREKIHNFVTSMSFGGGLRYVFIDEGDYLTPGAQAILRNLIETYANTSRFIITCNYPDRIIAPLKSRLQGFHFTTLDEDAFQIRALEVLNSEGITLDESTIEILDTFIKISYPDLRKCINLLQQYSSSGKLILPTETKNASADYMISMVELFKNGRINDARKLICSQIRDDEYLDLYKFLYRNLSFWGNTEDKQEQAIIEIAKALRNHTVSADPEINLAACLVALKNIYEG